MLLVRAGATELQLGRLSRAGLLATQGIRGGASLDVLRRIKATGDIFFAESDRRWILEGAAVRVSMVGFDNGTESRHQLNGSRVGDIGPSLTRALDLTTAKRLTENGGVCFMGPSPKGPFDIDEVEGRQLLSAGGNLNGKPNSDVVRPVITGKDIVGKNRKAFTIDFGQMSEDDAELYQQPFALVLARVKPIRSQNRRSAYAKKWWQYAEPRPGMRAALSGLTRMLVTPEVSKHRVVRWYDTQVLANQQTLVFARSDDYFFGVLQSHPHDLWALARGTQLESRPRYTPTTCFETFPLPWPPGQEPTGDPRVMAIGEGARRLNELRERWLNPPPVDGQPLAESELKKRTLTNLYNQRPQWLGNLHSALDEAVFAAYGWPATLTDEEILERLLAENLRRPARKA